MPVHPGYGSPRNLGPNLVPRITHSLRSPPASPAAALVDWCSPARNRSLPPPLVREDLCCGDLRPRPRPALALLLFAQEIRDRFLDFQINAVADALLSPPAALPSLLAPARRSRCLHHHPLPLPLAPASDKIFKYSEHMLVFFFMIF